MGINSIDTNNHIPNINSTPIKTQPHVERLTAIVYPMLKEINDPNIAYTKCHFSKPIDPTMAFARGSSIYVCPLFVIELSEIPFEIRPTGWQDPRLCDLKFLQSLSDWIANEYSLPKQTVSFIEAAVAKTILKLKADPQGMKALRTGLAHELGHVALNHSFSRKPSKEIEKEADLYAIKHLPDGLEGMKIGFSAWQECLRAVRSCPTFNWKTRLLVRLIITPRGDLVPLFFTHGFFDTRIKQAEQFRLSARQSMTVCD